MSGKTILQKLAVLADAAKYGASYASSGTARRHSVGSKGIGSTGGMGICHRYAGVRIDAMHAEMPKKYRHNLPAAQDIAPLLAGSGAPVEHMRAAAVSAANPRTEKWRTRVSEELAPIEEATSLEELARAVGCRTRRPPHCNATQAAFVADLPRERKLAA